MKMNLKKNFESKSTVSFKHIAVAAVVAIMLMLQSCSSGSLSQGKSFHVQKPIYSKISKDY